MSFEITCPLRRRKRPLRSGPSLVEAAGLGSSVIATARPARSHRLGPADGCDGWLAKPSIVVTRLALGRALGMPFEMSTNKIASKLWPFEANNK